MLELQIHGPLARLAIRRAGKMNAFTEAMWRALLEHCRALDAAAASGAADAPRVLVLEGEPGVFCAGADISEMAGLVRDPEALRRNNRCVTAAQLALEHLRIPTLAVIDGPCFGGGMGIAAACDFRLASTRASFAVTPARLGLVYSLEDTRRLVRLLGDQRARRLLLRAERIDGPTALAWGLLDELAEPGALHGAAGRWASGLAGASRTSMAGIKATLALLSHGGTATEETVRAGYEAAFAGADFEEGSAAFLGRREPRFG